MRRFFSAPIAVLTVLAIGAVGCANRSPGDTGTPPDLSTAASTVVPPVAAPSPIATPRVTLGPIDPSAWTTYESDRYGFSIDHPTDWTEVPADHDWTFENDVESWSSTATESFFHPGAADGLGVKVSAWAATVTSGATPASWLRAWCDATNPNGCPGLEAGVIDVETGDGHAGVLSQYGDTMAAFVDGETVYVVGLWRGENDPSVHPYGGARRLIEAYISTLVLPEA